MKKKSLSWLKKQCFTLDSKERAPYASTRFGRQNVSTAGFPNPHLLGELPSESVFRGGLAGDKNPDRALEYIASQLVGGLAFAIAAWLVLPANSNRESVDRATG